MMIVTGMHRSGTSLLAMTLEQLGVPFGPPEAFYQADQWNARGYFERRDVIDVDSRMISGLDRTGSRSAKALGQVRYLTQPRLSRVVARGERYHETMAAIAQEVGDGAVKDPRMCLTWSAWAQVAPVSSVVVGIRHPYDVAQSLRRRQSIPTQVGLSFWRYHIAALRDRTPDQLVVVDTERLQSRPNEELAALVEALGLEVSAEEAVRRFAAVHAPDLTTVQSDRPTLDRRTSELWAWLQEQAQGRRPLRHPGTTD